MDSKGLGEEGIVDDVVACGADGMPPPPGMFEANGFGCEAAAGFGAAPKGE